MNELERSGRTLFLADLDGLLWEIGQKFDVMCLIDHPSALGSIMLFMTSDACRMQQLNYSYFSKDNL